ncbi:MAG: hypothetical protein IT319_00990 [Anaerolineae bacterium]|nr:hypothetical protein [Anaerolineae bacterium]
MRSFDEYKQILELWELGVSKKAISRQTAIPRRTVIDCIQRYGTVENLVQESRQTVQPLLFKILTGEITGDYVSLHESYAYLLGLYLGDGNIVKTRNVYRLRITLDAKYPQIIETCMKKLQLLFPQNQIGIVESYYQDRLSYVNVSLYYRQLPEIFPQHGKGQKHTRQIVLSDWQQTIVDTYPLEFFRGLYHSDGSRFSNIVNGKDYPRYQFTNYSDDIRRLFCDTCDRLGLHWTVKQRGGIRKSDVFVSKRKDVAFLDSVVGPKS